MKEGGDTLLLTPGADMPTPDELYQAIVDLCVREIPGFKVRFKEDSFKMKAIGVFLWPVNRKFMKGYTTTVYPFVYFPSRKWLAENKAHAAKVLAHEFTHLWDEKDRGHLAYKVSYLSPQIVGICGLLGLLGFVWPPAVWASLMGFFAFPIPSFGRKNIERRGYAMSIAMNMWRYGKVTEYTIGWIAKAFTSGNYYWMWPFKKKVRRFIAEDITRIGSGSIMYGAKQEPFRKVHAVLKEIGALAA